ncbi:MAG: dihydroorotate dehydrogenase electron transfer subunit [Magnetococcales bacterium]|nr:dihydroorotate dehydrogenase electron transfer subunit [Magnetococcales bacterium]MBF0420543.1 dihydroorotate dehydrogenase electron transfer subunit [Magnetococcales bacterium]
MSLSFPPLRYCARILDNRSLGGALFHLVLGVPPMATRAQPGHFLQLDCHPSLTLPRPFSIMGVDGDRGTVDIFYQVVGAGTAFMSQWQPGQEAWVLGPLGSCFTMPPQGVSALLVAGGVGLAPLRFLAHGLRRAGVQVTLLWGLEAQTIPFATVPALLGVAGEPVPAPMALQLEENAGIATRLASMSQRDGFYHGLVSDLLEKVIAAGGGNPHLYVCGPTAMMVAVQSVAKTWGLQGEVSLESHMACGFGGCAGCVVPVAAPDAGVGAWRYVKCCTEGPVLPLGQVLWNPSGAQHR